MKKIKILSILMLFFVGLFFVGCEKDFEDKSDKKVDVEFGIVDAMQLKSDGFDIECEYENAVKAEIVIDGTTYTPNLIVHANGNLYTEVLKLESGLHTVTSFKLLDIDDNIVSATPLQGSEYAIYVKSPVEFTFTTEEFDKTQVEVEVLCFNIAEYENFGFNWFNIGQVEIFEIPFFGDLCIDPTVNYTGSGYDTHFEPLEFNYPIDVPAIFEVRTFVSWDGGLTWNDLKVFSNLDENGEYIPNSPVFAEYFTHSSGLVHFQFELHVWDLIEDGNGGTWDYIHYYTWEFDSENPPEMDSFGVMDFVVGYCVHGSPPDFTFPPSNGEEPEPIGGEEETAWGGNILGGGAAWWYYFEAEIAIGDGVPIYAGQNLVDGASVTIEYEPYGSVNPGQGDWFNMIIDLGPNMILQDGDETVKIQRYNYQTIPSTRPAPGQFTTYKGNQLVIRGISWTTSGHYYAVHLDVIVLD